MVVPKGVIERGRFGKLRLRHRDEFVRDAENGSKVRRLYADELTGWWRLQRLLEVVSPRTDRDFNLVQMRIGPRLLQCSPLGELVVVEREGTAPFDVAQANADMSLVKTGLELPSVSRGLSEDEVLFAILQFVEENELSAGPQVARDKKIKSSESRRGALLHRGPAAVGHRILERSRWSRCPICRAPLVLSRHNPRILHSKLRPGRGSIVDLAGGYMSRLKETSLLREPRSFVEDAELQPDFEPAGI